MHNPFTAFSGTGYFEVNLVGDLNVSYLLLHMTGVLLFSKV